jgi:integrase
VGLSAYTFKLVKAGKRTKRQDGPAHDLPRKVPVKLTTAAAKTLTLPPGVSDRTYFDDDLAGFGLRLRAGGSRKWVVQYDYGGKTRRMTLGAVEALDPGVARKRAKDVLAARTLGHDPSAEKQEKRAQALETFAALLPRYLAVKQARLRPRSYVETERHLTVHAKPLHHRPVADIDRRMVAVLITAIAEKSGPTAANSVRASLSGYFTWLAREGLVDSNAVAFTNKADARGARARVLSDDELRDIWRALEGQYGDIVKLLTLTAARRAEIGDLSYDEVDLDAAEIRLPAARMKGGVAHVIPLSPAALAILTGRERNGRGFVFGRGRAGFGGWSSAKRALDACVAPMDPWTLHDLRRTASTIMHDRLGIPPHVVEACLAHVGHRAGVAGVYNKASYATEKRRALERWAAFIDEIVSGKRPAGAVVRLRPK